MLQHLLFQLAVDGQYLGMADKGKGQNGDSVGGLEEWLKKLPTIVIAIQNPHFFNQKQHVNDSESLLQPHCPAIAMCQMYGLINHVGTDKYKQTAEHT